jgi:hypothetical protein
VVVWKQTAVAACWARCPVEADGEEGSEGAWDEGGMGAEGRPRSKTAREGDIIVNAKSGRSYVSCYEGIGRKNVVTR